MDFHAMKRKQLQELCKKHGVPANLKNVEMANTLASIFKEKEKDKDKEKEQLEIKGKSCLKIIDENPSDDIKNLAKKVKFSPQNETFEFRLENDRAERIKAREMRKRSAMKMEQEVKAEVSKGVPNDGIKITRSRSKKSTVGDVVFDVSCPPVEKKTRRNVKLREKGVNDVVEMDSKVDARAGGFKRSKRSADENLAGEREKFEMEKALRRSRRNVTEDNNLVQLNGEAKDVDREFEAGGGSIIVPGVVVNEEHEMILEPTRAIGRKSAKPKAAVSFIEPEKKITAVVDNVAKTVEHMEAPDENEKDLIPTRTLRRSRRQTTLFKSNASVNVDLEITENVGRNKLTKISTKSLSCEQTLATSEFPCRSTRNSSKHDSVADTNDMKGNCNRKETRKRARRGPNILEKVPVLETVNVKETIPEHQALSADIVAETELNSSTVNNSSIIDAPTNAIIDEEDQDGIQINVDRIEQSAMLTVSGQFSVEKEHSTGHDTEVLVDTMCKNEIFTNDDGLNGRAMAEKDVKLNAPETDLTLDVDIATSGIKLGCEVESVLMASGCQVVDYTESVSPEMIMDNVSDEVSKEMMRGISCGEGISPTAATTKRASRVIEDIPASVHSRSIYIEEKEDEDLVSSDFNVSVTGTSSGKQIERTDNTAQMIVGSLSSKESQDVSTEGENTLNPNTERTSPIIGVDKCVNEEPKESDVVEASNMKGSNKAHKIQMCELSVDKDANTLLSQERRYGSAHTVEETRELEQIHCEFIAKTAAIDDMGPEISKCNAVAPLFTPIHPSERTGMDDLEVSASLTNFSVREVATYPDPICGVLDECSCEGVQKDDQDTDERPNIHEEKPLESELGEGNLNETLEMYMSQTSCKVLGEKFTEIANASISFDKASSYQNFNGLTAQIKEDNKVDFSSAKSSSSPDVNSKELSTTVHVSHELYDRAKDERRDSDRATEFCESELGDDGDFHNGDAQANRNTLSSLEETIGEETDFFVEKASVEIIQTSSPCSKDICMLKEEENTGASQYTSSFANYDATYDDKVRKEGKVEDSAVEFSDNVIRERETVLGLEAELAVDGASRNVAAQVNGSVSSNWDVTVGEENAGFENDTSLESNLNTVRIDMSMEEESGGTSSPRDSGPDLLVSDYGDEHVDMYLNGFSSSSDKVKEKSGFNFVKSISEGNEFTYLGMDTEYDAIQQHNEMVSSVHTVGESEESRALSSDELMPANIDVEDRKENFRTLIVDCGFDHEKKVDVPFESYASAEYKETDAGNHTEEVKAAEMVHESRKDDHMYERADENSDLAVAESIFECNETALLLTGSEKAITHKRDQLMTVSLADTKDTMVQEADQRNSIATNAIIPVSAEVGDRKDTFRTIEEEVDIGDEFAGRGVAAVVLDALSQNDERRADSHMEELIFSEVRRSNHEDSILEKSKNVDDEDLMDIVGASWTSVEYDGTDSSNHVEEFKVAEPESNKDGHTYQSTETFEKSKNVDDEDLMDIVGASWTSVEYDGTDSSNHVEEFKVAEPDSNKDGHTYQSTETFEETTHITTLRNMEMGMDVETSDLVVVESFFECNASTLLLTDLGNHNTDEHNELISLSLADHNDNNVQEVDERNPLATNETMPVSAEVGDRTETFRLMEGKVSIGDEKTGGGVVPDELNGTSQNNEMSADNDTEELYFAEVKLSDHIDPTVEKSETVEDEAPLDIVKDANIVDASCRDLEPDTSHVTAASPLSSCKVQIDTQFKGDNDVKLENSSIQDEQKVDGNTEADTDTNEKDNAINSASDHLDIIYTTDTCLLEELHCERETKSIAEEMNKEAQGSSSTAKKTEKEVVEIAVSDYVVDDITMKPELEVGCIATSPVMTHGNGAVELQVESSQIFSSREINIFLEVSEVNESYKENATPVAREECSKGDDQTVVIENSFAHAASDEPIAETDDLNQRGKHNVAPMDIAFSFSAKPLSSSTIEVKKSRPNLIQRTPAKEITWTVDMKENTSMMKTEQTAIVKQSTKRRALEDIQKN